MANSTFLLIVFQLQEILQNDNQEKLLANEAVRDNGLKFQRLIFVNVLAIHFDTLYALQKYENYNAKQLKDCLASLHFEITEEKSDDN